MASSLLSLFFFQAEDGIRDYKVTGVQTCALPILRQVDERFREIESAYVESESPQSKHDRGLLDRPDGAAVITQRVVEGVVRGERPDAPAAEQARREHAADHGRDAFASDDAAGETVPHVRRDAAHLPLLWIERQRVELLVLDPPI